MRFINYANGTSSKKEYIKVWSPPSGDHFNYDSNRVATGRANYTSDVVFFIGKIKFLIMDGQNRLASIEVHMFDVDTNGT